MKGFYRIAAGCVMVALLMSLVMPAQAAKKDFFMSRKFHGAVLLGLGGLMIKEAMDARSDANDAYAFYKTAATPQVAQTFYDDSKRYDTRAAIFAVLGTGAVLYSAHLLLKTGDDDLPPPKLDRDMVNVKGLGLDVGGDLMRGQMQVRLKKGF